MLPSDVDVFAQMLRHFPQKDVAAAAGAGMSDEGHDLVGIGGGFGVCRSGANAPIATRATDAAITLVSIEFPPEK